MAVEHRSDLWPQAVRWVTAAVLAIVVVVPIVGNQVRVADVDPEFMRDLIERVHRFGGTFYQNGIYNKGVLEPFVYNLARHLGGYDGMWLTISAFADIAAVICAFVMARTVRWTGGPKALALAAGAALYIHLTVSPSNYAGVFYARNMTVTLLAVAWLVAFEDRCWRSPRARLASAVALGALFGVVVNSLLTEVFACAAIALAAGAMVSYRAEVAERLKLVGATLGSAFVVFVAVPVWYLLRGSFDAYWASWYTDATFQSTGTRRSLASQFALGWHKIYGYYQHRSILLLVIAAFIAFTYATWPRATTKERAMNVSLLGWLAAAWLEQVLNQRYSAHYFVINAVPTALMIAVLLGHAGRAVMANPRMARTSIAWPLIAVVGTVYLSGGKNFMDAVKRTSGFTTVRAAAQDAADGQAGPVRSARGVLDLVSRDNDAVLAWTNEASRYLDWHRVAAGRFIWKSFLTGEVYLGASGPQYVLPHTWEWFRSDIARSKPVAFVETNGDPTPGTPFASLVSSRYRLVFDGGQRVYLRNDVADRVLKPSSTTAWVPQGTGPQGSGWTASEGTASYSGGSAGRQNDALPLVPQGCFRLDGTISGPQGDAPRVDFRFEPTSDKHRTDLKIEPLHLRIAGERATSASDAVEYESVPSGLSPGSGGSGDFSLVVGRRAAVLVVNGQVRAALRLPSAPKVSITSGADVLELSNLRVGPVSAGSGC
jgi:hypothetical protein